MHSQWWFYLFAKLYVGSLPIVLFSMEVSGGRQMQFYNTVNKYVYKNKSNGESVNSICCHSQLCQKNCVKKQEICLHILLHASCCTF